MQGKCVKFDRIGRWGFITPLDTTLPDHFVHASSILGPKPHHYLYVGQEVEFDSILDSEDRPQAVNVRKYPFVIAIQRSAPAPVPGEKS